MNQNLIFDESCWNWKTDNLYSFLYDHENIPPAYKEFFLLENTKKELLKISTYLEGESKSVKEIFPPLQQVFRALYLTPKPIVCILGQDPYTNKGSACGLSFSVENRDIKINQSLLNIQKEVEKEGWKVNHNSGDLSKWAKQGILLLNSALTVKEDDGKSHTEVWGNFTENLIKWISTKYKIVWMLWGGDAMDFESDIVSKEYIIKTSHPSPLSYGKESRGNHSFKDSGCFTKCNLYLQKLNVNPIDWSI